MKIAIFQTDFSVGGIQRSLLNLLNSGTLQSHTIHVFLFQKDCFYQAPSFGSNITIRYLPQLPYGCKFIPFDGIHKHCNLYHNMFATTYDLAIDYNGYQPECALATLTCPAQKRVMWLHNDFEKVYQHEPKYRILWHFMKEKFSYFDAFVAVSDGIVAPFLRLSHLNSTPVFIIPNWIDVTAIHAQALQPISIVAQQNHINLVTMGRLCHQKGIDLLLYAFARAYAQNNALRLWIIGDGTKRHALIKQVKRLQLTEGVHFLGYQQNPFAYLSQMDAFVLASRYEGQGMVLWEAKACGLPLIFPKELESYTNGLRGVDDFTDAFLHVTKQKHIFDTLELYHKTTRNAQKHLFDFAIF